MVPGRCDATGSWMDLFKGVYSAEDTIAKRHDVVCRGKGKRDEEIERKRDRGGNYMYKGPIGGALGRVRT